MTCFTDENAVSFAQAEKLYYETSLINVSNDIQQEQGEAGECTFPNQIENNQGRAGRGEGGLNLMLPIYLSTVPCAFGSCCLI